MNVIRAFRNLDRHGQQRAPEVIDEEARQLESHLKRFRADLVRLEVTASQTKGKNRIHVSLRLQLPSGVVAAQEDGFLIEPVLRKAFADLRHQVDRHVARLKHDCDWKRRARRRRTAAPLPPVRDQQDAERRALFFELIEDHLDRVYDAVRRELTYLEASGSVPEGYLNVRTLVDATILNGLDQFERRPSEFSVGDWLTQLANDTIEAEAQAARQAVPEEAASIDAEPEVPAEEPTESDQEMFEFYQPDEVLLLQDLIPDALEDTPEAAADAQEATLALHRALAGLPVLWRRVLYLFDLNDTAPEQAATLLGISRDEVMRIAQHARAYLRDKLQEYGHPPDKADAAIGRARERRSRIPQPLQDRERIEAAFLGRSKGEST